MSTTYQPARGAADCLRHPDGAPEQARRRRAYWLVLLTLVLPGSAQLVAGNRRLGRAGLRVWLGVVAALVLLGLAAWLDRSLVLSVLTRTAVLWVLMLALVALAAGWLVLFVDAWRLAGPSRLPGGSARLVSGLTAVLMAVTAGPLLYGGYLVATQRRLISSVFDSGVQLDPVDGRYNVLLIGGDAGDGRVGLRADSINLVSVDADTGAVVQVGIPRNLVGAPFPATSPLAAQFPDGFDAYEGLMNATYTYGAEHPELFPAAKDPGAEAVKDAVEGVTGVQVQYYVLVDLHGFEALVDALGGIEVDVRTRVAKASMEDRRAKAFIEPGVQRLNGADALWFARSRFESTDYERMARQRCVMSAMLAQLDPQTVLLRFGGIATASAGLLSTDIPEADLGAFADLALAARAQPVTSVQLVPPAIDTGDPDFDETRRLVAEAVRASEDAGTRPSPAAEAVSPPPAESAPPAGAAPDAPAPQALAEVCAAA